MKITNILKKSLGNGNWRDATKILLILSENLKTYERLGAFRNSTKAKIDMFCIDVGCAKTFSEIYALVPTFTDITWC